MSDYAEPCLQIAENKCITELFRSITNELENEEPFYIADLADIVNKYRTWRRMLPGVHPYYAVKCNSDPLVLQLLVSLGVSFDCASKGEIEAVLQAGAQPSDIIFAHCYKSRDSLRYAHAVGVNLMTFDSEDELRKIKAICSRARLIIRTRLQNDCAAFPLNKKFGCDYAECCRLLKLAHKLSLEVIGVSFHVGSLCEDPEAYERGISLSRTIFDEATEMGFNFEIVDIGGGYPGASGTFGLFKQMCSCINGAIQDHFPQVCGVRFIAEPGCYFVCSAFTLCTTVIGKRENENNDDEKAQQRMYYINDSTYGSFGVGFEKYGIQTKPLLTQADLRHRALVSSKLWGSTCCSMDCIYDECLLPELEVGECILFENTGAYTLSLASNFNGFPKPSVKYVYSSRYGSTLRNVPLKHSSKNLTLSVLNPGDIVETLAIQEDDSLLNG